MKKYLYFLLFGFFAASIPQKVDAQVYVFDCYCGFLSGSNCQGCSSKYSAEYFDGLVIKRNGVEYKYISKPYSIRQAGENMTISDGKTSITIARSYTNFITMIQFRNALGACCSTGGGGGGIVDFSEMDFALNGSEDSLVLKTSSTYQAVPYQKNASSCYSEVTQSNHGFANLDRVLNNEGTWEAVTDTTQEHSAIVEVLNDSVFRAYSCGVIPYPSETTAYYTYAQDGTASADSVFTSLIRTGFFDGEGFFHVEKILAGGGVSEHSYFSHRVLPLSPSTAGYVDIAGAGDDTTSISYLKGSRFDGAELWSIGKINPTEIGTELKSTYGLRIRNGGYVSAEYDDEGNYILHRQFKMLETYEMPDSSFPARILGLGTDSIVYAVSGVKYGKTLLMDSAYFSTGNKSIPDWAEVVVVDLAGWKKAEPSSTTLSITTPRVFSTPTFESAIDVGHQFDIVFINDNINYPAETGLHRAVALRPLANDIISATNFIGFEGWVRSYNEVTPYPIEHNYYLSTTSIDFWNRGPVANVTYTFTYTGNNKWIVR